MQLQTLEEINKALKEIEEVVITRRNHVAKKDATIELSSGGEGKL